MRKIFILILTCIPFSSALAEGFEYFGKRFYLSHPSECKNLVRPLKVRPTSVSDLKITSNSPVNEPTSNRLRIVHWSLKNLSDKKLMEEPEFKSALIGTLTRDRNTTYPVPDLIFLTEINNKKSFQKILEFMPDYSGILQHFPYQRHNIGLLLNEKFPFHVTSRLLLSFHDTELQASFRGIPEFSFYRKNSTEPFLKMISLHLKSVHAFGGKRQHNLQLREKQLIAFLEKLKTEEEKNPHIKRILVGDFNTNLNYEKNDVSSRLLEIGYKNALDNLKGAIRFTNIFYDSWKKNTPTPFSRSLSDSFFLNSAARKHLENGKSPIGKAIISHILHKDWRAAKLNPESLEDYDSLPFDHLPIQLDYFF